MSWVTILWSAELGACVTMMLAKPDPQRILKKYAR